jgi:hypothetical protein
MVVLLDFGLNNRPTSSSNQSLISYLEVTANRREKGKSIFK